jgi:hypothetical protein
MFRREYRFVGLLIVLFFSFATGCAEDVSSSALGLQGHVSSVDPGLQRPDQNQVVEAVAWPVLDDAALQVQLSAPQTTISYDDRRSRDIKFELPLLYLHRQRDATPAAARTLQVRIAGLVAGNEVQLEAASWHADVTSAAQHVETMSFVSPKHPCDVANPCHIQWTFDAATTPSDLYRLRVKDGVGKILWSSPYPDRPDFLMLDTWDVGLDDYKVRIFYATLFPFARGEDDLDNRLPSADVPGFIANQFIPILVENWHTQVHEWRFGEPMHPNWDSDHLVEIYMTAYPFALFDGTGTYTVFADATRQPYPERRIWWYTSNGSFQLYDSLESGCKVIFAHEFFHLMQWNVLLNSGRPTDHWLNSFVESQGRFVQSAMYPELELSQTHLVREHSNYVMRSANRFLTERLNTSYQEMEHDSYYRYDLAMYWRYLYEQFNGIEVARVALQEMTRHYDPDIVGAIGTVMDNTFAQVQGPVHTHEESLIGFARATYTLRLANGRCVTSEFSACGGYFYDPQGMYTDPTLEARIDYRGGTRAYAGSVPASYGMDLIEVRMDAKLLSQPLTITFQTEGAVTRFNVQIWELGEGRPKMRALTPVPDTSLQNHGDVPVNAVLSLDGTQPDAVAVIITRLDSDEALDSAGSYRITLASAVEASNGEDAFGATIALPRDGSVAQ